MASNRRAPRTHIFLGTKTPQTLVRYKEIALKLTDDSLRLPIAMPDYVIVE